MRKLWLLLGLILLFPGLLRAEIPYGKMAWREISLAREYVQSASLFADPCFETPWPAEVLLAEDLRRFGWETLAQILEY